MHQIKMKHLRQRDSSGNAKSSWRITVRQLESMLRSLIRIEIGTNVLFTYVLSKYVRVYKSVNF